MLATMMPRLFSTMDHMMSCELSIALERDLIVRMRIIWMMVIKMPREKRPRMITFLRVCSRDFNNIGNGVSILVGTVRW